MKKRTSTRVPVSHGLVCGLALVALTGAGCKRIVTYAIDKELGDDAGLAAMGSTGGGSSSSGTTDACKLLTQAEVEAASGKKVVKVENISDGCMWTLSGGPITIADGASASVGLTILPEEMVKMMPMLGQAKDIPGIGDKAEWYGGMTPSLRVHKGDKVLNFGVFDPSAMLKNPGTTEKPVGPQTATGGNSLVNMEYPELEKTAVTLAKNALARY